MTFNKPIALIRKEVAILANKINKTVNDLSASFRRAWQMIKTQQHIISKVAGVVYGTRQRALRKLEQYKKEMVNVKLECEADNNHDANAVRIIINVGGGDRYHLGYVPSNLAALIAPLLDNGIQLAARFHGVTGGYEGREIYGALIAVEM